MLFCVSKTGPLPKALPSLLKARRRGGPSSTASTTETILGTPKRQQQKTRNDLQQPLRLRDVSKLFMLASELKQGRNGYWDGLIKNTPTIPT
jgi:hypothetical protein